MLRPTCLLCHLYELSTSATLRFSQEFVDGINLRVRIVLQANVGSKYCVRDSAPGETLPRYAETVQHFWIVDETRWDENAGLRRDAISSQVIDALEAQGDKGDRQ